MRPPGVLAPRDRKDRRRYALSRAFLAQTLQLGSSAKLEHRIPHALETRLDGVLVNLQQGVDLLQSGDHIVRFQKVLLLLDVQ